MVPDSFYARLKNAGPSSLSVGIGTTCQRSPRERVSKKVLVALWWFDWSVGFFKIRDSVFDKLLKLFVFCPTLILGDIAQLVQKILWHPEGIAG